MRLQTTCRLDNALSGLEIIELLVGKEPSFFGGHVHRGQQGSLVFLPRNRLPFIHLYVKTCRNDPPPAASAWVELDFTGQNLARVD